MSVKHARATRATAKERELREGMATKARKQNCTAVVARSFRAAFNAGLKPCATYYTEIDTALIPLFQEQTAKRRRGQSQRLLESVRGDRFGLDAAAVADVAAPVEAGIAVQELG